MKNNPIILKDSCLKTLSAVEADPNRSNQHELNGIAELKKIFGESDLKCPALFSIRGSDVEETVEVTWYEARDSHPTRSEYRLYFKTNKIMEQAVAGDSVLIGLDEFSQLHFVLLKLN